MCTGSHPEKIVAFDMVPYKACQAKLFNWGQQKLVSIFARFIQTNREKSQIAVTYRDYAIVILKVVSFFVINVSPSDFWKLEQSLIKPENQEVFIIKQWNFVRFCIRHLLTHRKNCRVLQLWLGIQLEYLEGSISMTHTVYYIFILDRYIYRYRKTDIDIYLYLYIHRYAAI
jgi:hypothetical protein